MSTPSGRGRPGPPQPRRRVLGTGTALFLIAAGAILRFAVATTSTHGLNVHVVGIILILIGVLGLVLSLLMSSPLNARRLSPWLRPRGHGNPGVDEIKEAAAADVASIQEDDRFFRPAGPEGGEDDL